ncbi:hypothetical protein BK125_17180 [Paenibacillus odorifer]|uniref:EVE domain-containing protein n=1 Tax=Paenibacillus odorifer TaxID=189426 RepID=A0ABX3GN20_9BACL|nr:HNH endonuclease [Paenibacillus odorifer]OMC76786.1 hypothetical protein BK125_17180 [Paenibacillus odorifer]OMD33151.1 hypothetical protein BSO21_15730 [Paenibacillus odorifer]
MKTWIFQGNPKRFKLDEYLIENKEIVWAIKQKHFLNDVQVGDTVFMWRSDAGKKGSGGVVARTTVTGKPMVCTISPAYWTSPVDASKELPRVPLHIEELALEGNHLDRNFIKNNEIFSDLSILKMSNGTNWLLSNSHAEELNRLWQDRISKLSLIPYEIPRPVPVSRKREFVSYSEQHRREVIYEYLFNGNTHRWIDENILELNPEWSRGYQAMGILHHLGLKNDYKGLFKGLSVAEAITILEQECAESPADYNLFVSIILELGAIVNKEVDSYFSEESSQDIQAEEMKEYPEGKIAYILHKKRERNSKLIKDAKGVFISKYGRLYCEACDFDFQKVYGDRGIDFIEGHHKKLLSEMDKNETTKIEDIAMLCSNCHRMVHRKPLISVEELKQLMKKWKGTN